MEYNMYDNVYECNGLLPSAVNEFVITFVNSVIFNHLKSSILLSILWNNTEEKYMNYMFRIIV